MDLPASDGITPPAGALLVAAGYLYYNDYHKSGSLQEDLSIRKTSSLSNPVVNTILVCRPLFSFDSQPVMNIIAAIAAADNFYNCFIIRKSHFAAPQSFSLGVNQNFDTPAIFVVIIFYHISHINICNICIKKSKNFVELSTCVCYNIL